MSVAAGSYPAPFNLTITAPEGSVIYYSLNDGSIPSPEKVDNKTIFLYKGPIRITNRTDPAGKKNILSSEENLMKMYRLKDDGDPGSEYVPTNYIPNDDQVPKATVVRAMYVDSNGERSSVITRTFFVDAPGWYSLNKFGNTRIISLVTDPSNLLDDEKGIFVRGVGNTFMTADPGKDLPPGLVSYNFRQSGLDWERDVNFEIFDGSGTSRTLKIATEAGMRVKGGYSREFPQRGLNIYLRGGKYGIAPNGLSSIKNMNLITDSKKANGMPMTEYKQFTLRNGGNDTEFTKIFDLVAEEIVRDRNFDTQTGVPCVVFINGEYWGPMILVDKYSDNQVGYKFGVNNSNVIIIKTSLLSSGLPEDFPFYEYDYMGYSDLDMTDPDVFDSFCNIVDIDNYIDYWASQIFLFNQDWPANNNQIWRTRTKENDFYGDTRWRYQMYDCDDTLGFEVFMSAYNPTHLIDITTLDSIKRLLNFNGGVYADGAGGSENRLFQALLCNQEFCRRFVNVMMDLYNVNFNKTNSRAVLSKYINLMHPLMGDGITAGVDNYSEQPSYYQRWGLPDPYSPWTGVFEYYVNVISQFLDKMPDYMVETYLPYYFGGYNKPLSAFQGGGPYTLNDTASAASPNYGMQIPNWTNVSKDDLHYVTIAAGSRDIKINTITASSGWTGRYYGKNAITLTAIAPVAGATWKITGGTGSIIGSVSGSQVNVTFSTDITVSYN